MDSHAQMTGLKDMRTRLSTLWIFAVLNYLYADVMTLLDPEGLEIILSGSVGSVEISQGLLFAAALLMETAIVMVLLSRLLRYRANRILNLIIGTVHTLAVALSMFIEGPPAPYYILFGSIEIATTVLIVVFAARWKAPEQA